jgi:hypothetical protein
MITVISKILNKIKQPKVCSFYIVLQLHDTIAAITIVRCLTSDKCQNTFAFLAVLFLSSFLITILKMTATQILVYLIVMLSMKIVGVKCR